MNTMNTNDYNPADDGNQGIIQPMAQSEEATAGIPQDQQLNPVHASGPEPEKAEVALDESDGDYGLNDDVLEEEAVENGDADETNDD
ncbi:hypothetical protein H3H32_01630 [Spirosoma foliorum]|uniref:Uncharacterized protein n=2 Tax=Spirosoma foliorum TaxID=2710596 RepID=A0A7G5H6S3_9BACT|nr:hypothetical protein H3H32_01630 [Spirosoma foliorum]